MISVFRRVEPSFAVMAHAIREGLQGAAHLTHGRSDPRRPTGLLPVVEHSRTHSRAAAAGLTAVEADLAARLSPLLDNRPRRSKGRLCTQHHPGVSLDFDHGSEAERMPAIEDMEPAGEPKPLPVFADEPGVTAPEAAWLQHRPKVGMQSLESWLITVAVIAVIFCAAGVGLLGLDHSLELANAAMTQASATGAVLRTLIVH